MPRLKQELDLLEKQEIIRKVTEPTAWVHPMVLATKKDGGIRVCVDFTILNHNIIRPRFDTATPFQAVRTIPPGMKFFTIIDALKGYHQVQLDEESAALTTFQLRMASTNIGAFRSASRTQKTTTAVASPKSLTTSQIAAGSSKT